MIQNGVLAAKIPGITNNKLSPTDNMAFSNELHQKPHYMTSTDDALQLRHGLGLFLVHQIMHTHNGTFEIASELNKGFKIILIFQENNQDIK